MAVFALLFLDPLRYREVADGYPADSDNFVYRVLILNEVGDSTRNAPQEYYILGAYPTLDAAMDASGPEREKAARISIFPGKA